jgi:malate dehydrogenase
MKLTIKVAVIGPAGQIAYSLLPRIASGSMFGPDQPVEHHPIEVPAVLAPLKAWSVI